MSTMAKDDPIPVDDQNLFLRQIVDSAPALIHTARPDGYLDFFNQGWLNFVGQPLEKLLGWEWTSFIHPEDVEAFVQKWRESIATGEGFEDAARVLRADGEYRWMLHSKVTKRDSEGNMLKWFGSSVDITQAKRAEETLRKNERELRTLIDMMPVYVATSLPDGTVDFVSQSWLDYTGFTSEQAIGWGWTSVIHPDDRDRAVAICRAALASGEPLEQEVRARNADGIYRWFLSRNLPLRDENGNVVKWYGILFDIDALKEAEHALQMREHELVGIIDTVPSMLWSISPTGEITHVNQRVLKYFGAPFEELVHRGWERFVHPDDREENVKAFDRAIEAGESYSAIHRVRRADGEYRWHHVMGEPLRDPHGKIIQWYGLSIDIDERKRAEDHLRDTRIKLARASRLATVAELAASIAHELNQPLMSILANAQAANKWLNAAPARCDAEVNSSIERTIRDARAADETIQHIRALFKQKPVIKKEASILDMMREAVRLVQEDPNKREIHIDLRLDENIPKVPVDRIQIQEVFINLISNAIEAVENNRISPLIRVQAAVTDQNDMVIRVIDNGPGVNDPENIFDAFVTTKAKGMGIGLAVSRSIVEAHGGRLWAENGPDGGARFNVALPVSPVNRDSSKV